jgi:hypothetical protein
MGVGSAFMALAVGFTAINATCTLDGVTFWDVSATVAAGHHDLCAGWLWAALIWLALLAYPPNTANHDE